VIDNGADFDPGITIPNGGWNAPLADLETYLAFLTNSTHGDTALQARYDLVLPHRDLEEMWRPFFADVAALADSSSRGRTIETTGISFFVLWHDGVKLVGHTGSQAGFTAFIYLNPATSDAVVAAFNTEKIAGSGATQSSFAAIRNRAFALIGGPAAK
jgi:CubicO group peptidase (beta-lactamase class C family)